MFPNVENHSGRTTWSGRATDDELPSESRARTVTVTVPSGRAPVGMSTAMAPPIPGVIAVPLPTPGSLPTNHSTDDTVDWASVTVPVSVTAAAPLVGFGVSDRPAIAGPVLSTVSTVHPATPQLPAASLPRTYRVCAPSVIWRTVASGMSR